VYSPLLEQLIDTLKCLPGVGPKTAQRMAFHLLQRDKPGGMRLADSIVKAIKNIGYCEKCRTLSERAICTLCGNSSRDQSQMCIVESPADMMAVEHATAYKGIYFVLQGSLSPLDGIGPEDIGMDLFEQRLAENIIKDIILATSPTIEGETTAQYIRQIAHNFAIPISRIAHGIPMGGELEHVDSSTLSRAFAARQSL